MEAIRVARYAYPETHGWGGYIEPDSLEWILFIPAPGSDNKPQLYTDRDPRTGAVLEG